MNINGINNNATGSGFTTVSGAYIAATPAATKTPTANSESAGSQDTQDTVSISNAGREALSNDFGAPLREKALAKKNEAEVTPKEEPKTLIDEQIDKIKEKIKELQEILSKLKGDDSEAADQQRKMLQEQIMLLSGQIATLLDKKMQDSKKSD
ncbi:FlxA-like family protein [Shewanella oncorhynchi]|uniref:FlxA-like family protein n=1 Tax=Shewanella oncorhynchi TaxID=2726434 RepID=UPI002E7C054A|nr:FlxA-like family protein [Shewanella oncorhynchi]WVI91841.1 FlxA-like family protein [Shewanella oncorhynchi]